MDLEILEQNKKEKVIVSTIAFFDIFSYPLSPWEVWKYGIWQDLQIKYSEVVFLLEKLVGNNKLGTSECYYYFPEKKNDVLVRKARYNYFRRKIKRLKKVAGIFMIFPWIRMVAISNVMGKANLRDESDIDVFIVSKKNTVWLSRFFCAGMMKIFKLRPEKGNERDKICLNFYIDDSNLNLSDFKLKDAEIDIYFLYWVLLLQPVVVRGNIYNEFMQENNWVREYFPNWHLENNVMEKRELMYGKILIRLFDYLDRVLKKWQMRIFPGHIKQIINKDTRVVINNNIIKLHSNDRREEFRNKWRFKLSNNEE